MLVDSLHSTKQTRISSSLLDIYLRYKQDTRAIIAWLITHGTRNCERLQTVSIKDLLVFAENVQQRGVVMPETIDFHFREAIAARTQLSKFFRKEATPGVVDQGTTNHEYFTMSLTKIYTGLCRCCAKPVKSCDRSRTSRRSKDAQATLPNRFAVLKLGTCDAYVRPADNEQNGKGGGWARNDRDVEAGLKTAPRLVDDHLGDAFDLHKGIQEIRDLRLAAITVWEQAARAETPLVVAALITNAALAALEEVDQRLKALCNDTDPESLRSKFLQMKEALEAVQGVGVGEDGDLSHQVEVLQQPWNLLLHFKKSRRERRHDREFSTVQIPSSIILRKGADSTSLDRECLTMMLRNIEQHVEVRFRPTCIVRLGTPMFADIGYFFTHNEDESNALRCSYGLQLLLETYKSYLQASRGQRAPPCCRLQALRFAQEAIPNVRAVLDHSSMPCRCCHTLAFHLENLHLDFQEFIHEKVFDLYFQSPWVSGSHMLEMLELLFFYGLRLFSYRHYVGSIVHVYNVLRECTSFESVPLLEQICVTFGDILFPGGRPTRNFKACCFRYMGGRLRFDSQSSDHKSGSHRLCIPARTAEATAGFPLQKEANDSRFEYKRISFLHHVKERGYHLDHALWDRIYEITATANATADPTTTNHNNHTRKAQPSTRPTKRRNCPRPDCAHLDPANAESCTSSTASTAGHRPLQAKGQAQARERSDLLHPLHHLQTAILLTDFTGPFPIARVNFFKIYLACVRIVSLISDRRHQEQQKQQQRSQQETAGEGGGHGQGGICVCFVDDMLEAADRFRDNSHRRARPFGCRDLVDNCAESIREVLGARASDEFLWKGV